MNESNRNKKPYATWHKLVLIGCLLIAVIGTIVIIGGMVMLSSTISEYGGTIGAPMVVGFIMGLLSMWLFAGSGALLVYIAKTNMYIADTLQASSGEREQ
jgi:hypothetical protein